MWGGFGIMPAVKNLFILVTSFLLGLSVRADCVSLDLFAQCGSVPCNFAAMGRAYTLPNGAARLPTALKSGDELDLRLFDDVSVRLRLGAREESPLGAPVYLAFQDGTAIASVMDGADGLSVDLFAGVSSNTYSVVSSSRGVRVAERPSAPVGGCEDVVPVPNAAMRTVVRNARPRTTAASAATAAVPVVDILVAYDAGARAYAESEGGGLTNFAVAAVAKMNAALANTAIDKSFRFRLVGVTTVAAQTKSVREALSNASQGSAGWESIKAVREEVGADIVTVLVDSGSAYGVTGVANGMDQNNRDFFANQAYNACAIRAVQQGHSMMHEVGHNLGAGHATELYNQQAPYRGPQLYSYSSGYYFTGEDGTDYYTIMSYRDDGTGKLYTLAPYFSSPDHLYQNREVGDAYHDNTRTLQETGPLAAKWREQVVPLREEVGFEPKDCSHFSETVAVTLSAGAEVDEIRYTLDDTPPTLDSPRYTQPIVLTETTTIRAAAVLDGELAPFYSATYTKSGFGAVLGLPQLIWTTSADYPWSIDETGTECAVRSGDGGGYWEQPSELWTTIVGPTTLHFRYRMQGLSNYALLRVSVSGEASFETKTASPDAWQDEELAIPKGAHEVRFRFEVEGGRNPEPGYNGAWLTGLRLVAPNETNTPMPVPHTWIDEYPDFLTAAGGDYDAAARLVGANGLALWESYLAGLDPTNALSQFRARITLTDGQPVISWDPDLGAARVYRVRGKSALAEDWQDVEDDTSAYRFFQVIVEPTP